MTGATDRWHEIADAEAVGAPLSPDELAVLHEHADDHADELALYAELEHLGDAEAVREDDLVRAMATMQRMDATVVPAASPRRRTSIVTISVLAVAAAVALTFGITRWLGEPELASMRVSQGGFALAGDVLAIGDAVPNDQWVRATERACIEHDGTEACFEAGSELRLTADAFELRQGTMQVVTGDVIVRDGDDTRHVGPGQDVVVAPAVAPTPVAPADPPRVVAATPIVEAPPSVDVPPEVPAIAPVGTIASPRKSLPRPPSKTAGEMLALARAQANAHALGRAVAAYEALRRAHPDTAEAQAANVSIGELELRRGHAKLALRAFDRYLERGGALAEEARWGRVRALDKLGKDGARDRAIDALLAKHPRSIYLDEASAMRGR